MLAAAPLVARRLRRPAVKELENVEEFEEDELAEEEEDDEVIEESVDVESGGDLLRSLDPIGEIILYWFQVGCDELSL